MSPDEPRGGKGGGDTLTGLCAKRGPILIELLARGLTYNRITSVYTI